MNTRNIPRINYKILHETGKKVIGREKWGTKMANPLVVEEAKIMEDLEHSLSIYSLEQLDTIEEIKEGTEALNNRRKIFRHIHVELNTKYHD